MIDPYLGEIMWFAGNYVPRDFAACDGSELQIATHQALYALLGTAFGGDGITTFALPDLRGVLPVGRTGTMGAFEESAGISVDASGTSGPVPGTLPLQACIATAGVFPPRS